VSIRFIRETRVPLTRAPELPRLNAATGDQCAKIGAQAIDPAVARFYLEVLFEDDGNNRFVSVTYINVRGSGE
jgi:hypothetical protein